VVVWADRELDYKQLAALAGLAATTVSTHKISLLPMSCWGDGTVINSLRNTA